MRKNYWLYILLVCLLAISVLTIINRKAGKFKNDESRFAVRDTGAINLIEIKSEKNAVLLERMQDRWTVNGKYFAGNKKIAGLLMVISRLQVSAPVPESLKEEIQGRLRHNGKKVTVVTDSRSPHVILMYQDTVHTQTTYMMLEKSDQPFRVEIPGYPGKNLTGLFVAEVSYWRDNSIFRIWEDEIVSATRYDRKQPAKSFSLVNTRDSGYRLFRYPDSIEVKDFNREQARQYMSYFASVSFVRFLSDEEKMDQPALKKGNPDDIITIKDSGGNIIKVETFPLYVSGQNRQPGLDLNRLIAVINDTDVVVARYVELDPLIKDIDYFLEKEKNNLYN